MINPLAMGSPAPDFTLPGIDGKTYSLATFKSSRVLVLIFTAALFPRVTADLLQSAWRKAS